MEDSDNEDLKFVGRDPGAVRRGNFINYYAFHPASIRVENLPRDIWSMQEQDTLNVLDIGCNTGELTLALHALISENVKGKVRTLGIDLDPTLVERAEELVTSQGISDVEFLCADITKEDCMSKLKEFSAHVVALMSVTMWVHINDGDDALHSLLLRASQLTNKWIIIEPQPWNCYRTAQRRIVKKGYPGFPMYSSLNIKGPELLTYINHVITEECGMRQVSESKPSTWRRTTSIYEKV